MPRGTLGQMLFGREHVEPEVAAELRKFFPIEWSFQTEVLPLAGPGDKLAPGVGMTIARTDCLSLAVTNYGSVDLIVNNGEPNEGPALVGPGVAFVPPGGFAMLTMPGHFHSFYGRPGELVGVTRFPELQQGNVAQISPGLWLPVDLGTIAANTLAYTTPWGNHATYGGFTARNTDATNAVAFRVRDGSSAGTVLDDVNLAAGGSTEEDTTMTACATSGIFVEFLGGGGTLRLTLRVR